MALIILGVGFYLAHMFEPTLDGAFVSGGMLWVIVGGVTIIGSRVGKNQKLIEVK